MRRRALGRQCDRIVFERFEGLFRDEQDALDGAVRRNADVRQHAELFRVARVEDGGDVADVETAGCDVAVEHGGHAAPDVESVPAAAMGVSIGERQDIEEVDVSDSGLLLHGKTSLLILSLPLYTPAGVRQRAFFFEKAGIIFVKSFSLAETLGLKHKNEVHPQKFVGRTSNILRLIFQTILLQQKIKQIQYQNTRFVVMCRTILYNNDLLK